METRPNDAEASAPARPGPRRTGLAPRLALGVLGVGVAWVAGTLIEGAPRDTTVVYRLGPTHARVTAATIRYEHAGEPVASLVVRHPEGAPASLRHEVPLPVGRTRVVAVTDGPEGPQEFLRSLDVPVEGEAYVDLFARESSRR